MSKKEWLQKFNLKPRDGARLLRALCTLADYEGALKRALVERGHDEHPHAEVCDALRFIVDGHEDN